MGTSTDGILAYGYDLDGQDGLNVVEAQRSDTNEYGYLKTSWYDAEHEEITGDDGEEMGTIAILTKRLYDAIPDAPAVEYEYEREDPVKKHYGAWFEGHCSGEYPMYILTTHSVTARRGSPKTLDFTELEAQRQREEWDAKLARALAVLEVTPLVPAAWLLASDWG
jgi:hypothetical protein